MESNKQKQKTIRTKSTKIGLKIPKGVITNSNSKNDRIYNTQRKMVKNTNNDSQ